MHVMFNKHIFSHPWLLWVLLRIQVWVEHIKDWHLLLTSLLSTELLQWKTIFYHLGCTCVHDMWWSTSNKNSKSDWEASILVSFFRRPNNDVSYKLPCLQYKLLCMVSNNTPCLQAFQPYFIVSIKSLRKVSKELLHISISGRSLHFLGMYIWITMQDCLDCMVMVEITVR